jgi:glutaredoxin-related protein
VSGKLVGGLDIIKEMHEEGELLAVIPPEAK